MNVLDTSIANVSIPAISGDLGVSPDQGTWVITSFGVANAISLPLTGWLTRTFGQVKLFMWSVTLFTIASFLCALAPSLNMLILFRVLQGAVAGPMMPLSQALLLSSYPKAKAGAALGMWSITTLVAPVVGPVLGGWITDNISWPWIFYINVPVGIVAGAATWFIYKSRETPTTHLPIDKIGLFLLVIWVGSCRSCSIRARTSTGSTPGRSSPGGCRGGGIHALPGLGADGQTPRSRFVSVQPSQLPDQYNRNADGLRPVLRQRRTVAVVVATVHGVHGDTGRTGASARRDYSRSS